MIHHGGGCVSHCTLCQMIFMTCDAAEGRGWIYEQGACDTVRAISRFPGINIFRLASLKWPHCYCFPLTVIILLFVFVSRVLNQHRNWPVHLGSDFPFLVLPLSERPVSVFSFPQAVAGMKLKLWNPGLEKFRTSWPSADTARLNVLVWIISRITMAINQQSPPKKMCLEVSAVCSATFFSIEVPLFVRVTSQTRTLVMLSRGTIRVWTFSTGCKAFTGISWKHSCGFRSKEKEPLAAESSNVSTHWVCSVEPWTLEKGNLSYPYWNGKSSLTPR